jgi:predicted phage baseplate assembly protein
MSRLRFGDNVTGRRPAGGTVMTAWYRLGGGAVGNVGGGVLTTLLGLPGGGMLGGVRVTNPLPGAGGTDPEPLAEVRELAPYAFRTQLRAVTSADYAAAAMEDGEVQRAVARRRWTGSWYAQEVTLDPVASRAADPAVPARLARVLEVRRMAGVDVELRDPVAVPLEILVAVCVAPGYPRASVEQQLRDALSARMLPDGRRGFFHPDNLTFGQPVFLSDLMATVMAVPGVTLVDVVRFGRAGASAKDSRSALARGRLDAAPREVFRCDSDPDNPESGRLDLVLRGGS